MVRQHRTTAAVAITLALTASLASTASADPAPLARAEAAIAATQGSALVRPNADQQTAPASITYPRPCTEIC
jgi:D-alanyl-D-alanine carboxypeptidase